ncbi:hypothetical protein KDH_27420 [Dictyobacter sp. S3.2.2.5]|uniref:HTH merR-type domain-containing protein n=1 Tax=Dictyobacter halimunensis TaxID=3026934 RepID=A0ABQ6FQN8_9CHLR|nr:hypothetical protein KDH_27420 [Dictyobacter sp. S3.2.2.5]
MSMLPLADCARLLGIHPKTLRQWLKQDPLELVTHPRDARIKCLTLQHVEHLAAAHGRALPAQQDDFLAYQDTSVGIPPKEEATPAPSIPQEEGPLAQKLSLLETRIAQLSEQVAHLTLALLQERERTIESRLSNLETCVQQLAGTSHLSPASLVSLEQQIESEPMGVPPPRSLTRPLIEAEQRARSCMPPLIEYSAQNTYVIVSSLEGELNLDPASRAWFDWLATLTSFRFVGQSGRFTAYRDTKRGKRTRCWVAQRSFHGRHYKHWLGVTDRLTIDYLEQMASHIQAHLTTL